MQVVAERLNLQCCGNEVQIWVTILHDLYWNVNFPDLLFTNFKKWKDGWLFYAGLYQAFC